MYKTRITALINKEDILTKKIAESFGIKILYITKRITSFKTSYFSTMYIYNYQPTNKKFKNIKYKNFEIGKSALENYLRWHNNNYLKKINFTYLFLVKINFILKIL